MNEGWENYKNSVQLLLMGGNKYLGATFGSIIQLYDALQKEGQVKDFLQTHDVPSFWTQDDILFPFFMHQLQHNQIKVEALRDITNGSSGLNVKIQTHIVYATKTQQPWNRDKDIPPDFTFHHFYELYQDIIMCVGVTIGEKQVENRGIFRNPLSVVEQTYRGIAMNLHQFTCECVYFPELTMFATYGTYFYAILVPF